MSLSLAPSDRVERIEAELRRGAVAALRDQGTVWLVAAAESVSEARFKGLVEIGQGGALAMTARRAASLKLAAYDGDLVRVPLSAFANLAQMRALADPSVDLANPLRGPFTALRDGGRVAAHRLALKLCKRQRLLPAALVAKADESVIKANGLQCLDVAEGEAALSAERLDVEKFASAKVPLSLAHATRLHGFRPSDGGPDHYAVEIGAPSRAAPVLVRAHSECFTGDILGSLKCDCGPQLRAALAQISAEPGGGVLLYLAQEGRGIGMANKLRAYSLQDQGFDTVDANHRLGFEDDERDFKVAALMLQNLGFRAVRVLTNNPRKVDAFQRHGLAVAGRVPHAVGRTSENTDYLDTKAARSGHLL